MESSAAGIISIIIIIGLEIVGSISIVAIFYIERHLFMHLRTNRNFVGTSFRKNNLFKNYYLSLDKRVFNEPLACPLDLISRSREQEGKYSKVSRRCVNGFFCAVLEEQRYADDACLPACLSARERNLIIDCARLDSCWKNARYNCNNGVIWKIIRII